MADDIFSGVDQIEVRMGDFTVKMPFFSRDVRLLTAVFPASLLKLRKLLPDKSYVPAQIFPGLGAFQVGALEYHDSDLGPFNEFAAGVPLNSQQFLKIPGYNALRQIIQLNYDVYITHLMENTEVAIRDARDLNGLPAFLHSWPP